MTHSKQGPFFDALDQRCQLVQDYILAPRFLERFNPEEIRWAVSAYVRYGGKRLRPAILMFACGAVGGDEKRALPAAAAVEIFHTWTLVHDDIIDRDDVRRGRDTVHHHYLREARDKGFGGVLLDEAEAGHYGASIAILTGDIQHGWGISMMAELSSEHGLDPVITLRLIDELDTRVLNTLVEGEVLDIQFAHRDIESLTPQMIEDMLWKKTGALYEFCGRAGAMIGLREYDNPLIEAVARFAAKCGTAFQLQDDILGVIGKEAALGKPVGSDLREGKRTLVVYQAYHNASEDQRRRLMNVLGRGDATDDEVAGAIQLLRDLGGVDYVAGRARELIGEAQGELTNIPAGPYRDLLSQWGDFMIQREF